MRTTPIRWLTTTCILLMLGVCQAAEPKFDLGKATRALRAQVEETRAAATQAMTSASIDEKKAMLEKLAALKEKVQAFSDEAAKNGASEDAIGDALERLKITDLTKMERDLRTAVNEAGGAAKPKE
jgi:hypothetical protein